MLTCSVSSRKVGLVLIDMHKLKHKQVPSHIIGTVTIQFRLLLTYPSSN